MSNKKQNEEESLTVYNDLSLIEAIRLHNFYTGEKPTAEKVSVTEISGGDILQMVLRRKHDIPAAQKIGQNTLGSIFDLGIRYLVDSLNEEFGSNFVSGERQEMILSNGIILSGEADIIQPNEKRIYDIKLTKMYTVKRFGNEFDHQYRYQLNLYNILYGGDYDMFILWGLKDQSDSNPRGFDEAMSVTPVEQIMDGFLLDLAVEKSNTMTSILAGRQLLPEKCEDTWNNDLRCRNYCDVKEHCPYYQNMYGGNQEPF